MKNVQVYTEDRSINKSKVHKLIFILKQEYNFSIQSLSLSIISSTALHQINKKYLKHDYQTDVVSFNYSKDRNIIDGEILISFEDAKRNAKKFQASYGNEIFRLIIHGVLHLLNFDDTDAKSKKIMKKEENKLINKYYFTLLASK